MAYTSHDGWSNEAERRLKAEVIVRLNEARRFGAFARIIKSAEKL